MVKIRQEQPSDYDEVYELVKTSFATTLHCDGDEQDYLNDIRKRANFIPALSLVAVGPDGAIIGQIILHETDIDTENENHIELLLGPVSVHPDYFRRGIARDMIEEALRKATDMGYRAVFLCGDPKIYSKMGFVPTYKYGIFHKSDATAGWSMLRELCENALEGINGTIDTV